MKRDDIQFFKTRKLEDLNFLSNSPPSIFIGSKLKYPNVNVGILSPSQPLKQVNILNNSNEWTNLNLSIKEILSLRNQLINSRYTTQVKVNTKLTEKSQEIGMASRPTDLEINLTKKPRYLKEFDKITKPLALSAPLKNIRITQNTKIHTKVDKVVSDTDLKANEAINYLYKKGFDENFLQQLLTIGTLGTKKNRRLVPTRFGITATHDIIGKNLLEDIKKYNFINDCMFFGEYLGNYFLVFFFSNSFHFELIEFGVRYGKITGKWTDYESFSGRKDYASNSVGGYYAVRLGISERLKELKRQGSVLVFRLETEKYWANLGVWVVLSGIRKTLKQNPIYFDDRDHMLECGRRILMRNSGVDIKEEFKKSVMLNHYLKQKNLMSFCN